jgi:hypothetical protein
MRVAQARAGFSRGQALSRSRLTTYFDAPRHGAGAMQHRGRAKQGIDRRKYQVPARGVEVA